MNFYETHMWREFFEHQVPRLIKAINELTAKLSRQAPAVTMPVTADPDFLRDLYFGEYEPDIFRSTAEIRDLNRNVTSTHDALTETLSEQGRERLVEYEDALSARDSVVTEQAYESGFWTAVQMMAAGLSRPASQQSDGAESEAMI